MPRQALEIGNAPQQRPGGAARAAQAKAAPSSSAGKPLPKMMSQPLFWVLIVAVFIAMVGGLYMRHKLESMERKLTALEADKTQDCQSKCEFDALQGRWQTRTHGHTCWNEELARETCECTGSPNRPADCMPVLPKTSGGKETESRKLGSSAAAEPTLLSDATLDGASLKADAGDAEHVFGDGEGNGNGNRNGNDDADTDRVHVAGTADRSRTHRKNGQALTLDVSTSHGFTPSDTISQFCDGTGLADMHGKAAPEALAGSDAARDLESKILGDVARELETNNVDKMAREIFTFYVCTRWAPDETFWKLAEQELTAQIISSTVEHEKSPGQAIAELYQMYKFVPMLCSNNFDAFGKKDPSDNLYFSQFKKDVTELASWISDSKDSPVSQRLKEIDDIFCGDKPMNACGDLKIQEMLKKLTQWCPSWLCGSGGSTKEEMWAEMEKFFKSFNKQNRPDSDKWDKDFTNWKARFPYHSFIAKPEGWKGSENNSPRSAERFLICFGKRVASELHRRPSGQHILTDQNNIGCHGFWEPDKARDMLQRLLDLWKPPTCQLAEMTYVMKKEIMAKFQQMNERLFDALPSMINDEMLEAELGEFDFQDHLPKPYKIGSVKVDGQVFIDRMRVRASLPGSGSHKLCVIQKQLKHSVECLLEIDGGDTNPDYGRVHIEDNRLYVVWDKDEQQRRKVPMPMGGVKLKVVPQAWTNKNGFSGHVKNLVAGVGHITDKAKEMFSGMFSSKYQNLAGMMSESVSKWAVCPIQSDANLQELDGHLGVEDAAFQDFQKEAYKKWTGFKNKIPGESCVKSSVLGGEFDRANDCEISELMANHVEEYVIRKGTGVMSSDVKEQFVCPIRPPLPPDEQLQILSEKQGTCYLRMTREQQRQHAWHYQGKFPARRQNERKDNTPLSEYELVKLLKVSAGDADSETSFGRYCSLEELKASPRFCRLAKVHNNWPNLAEFTQELATSLSGSLMIGAAAVTSAVTSFQSELHSNMTKASEKAKKVALAVGEQAWDKLTGAGRLLRSSPQWVHQHLGQELPGDKRVTSELEQRLFGSVDNGELLHMMSYQKSVGKTMLSSNAKERFDRYVVSYPCPDFDPAFAFAARKRWSRVVLQMVQEAIRVHKEALNEPSLRLLLRGEGVRFKNTNEQSKDTFYYKSKAGMQWVDPNGQTGHKGEIPDCKKSYQKSPILGDCEPPDVCESTLFGSCRVKTWWSSEGWWPVANSKLVGAVAPLLTTGKVSTGQFYGLEMNLYCAQKNEFESSGPPVKMPSSLKECLEAGVRSNEMHKAREPWKLYFPEEVVVVATFGGIDDRRCLMSEAGRQDEESKKELCASAVEDSELFKHLSNSDMKDGQATFMGAHTGAGFPKGTLEEVVLQPEDVLEALGLMLPSNHGSWV
eukprot:TRINITY_DN58554_c0_g1_i1.p1 TRINITY_DN58554_c0_g1~~TRINITY_DN58554_c0_g1_i1.p1  ORF type:complete len:1393 (+),score=272.40 TRINITY_DN58554_c0_g1_i1:131-4309(+)